MGALRMTQDLLADDCANCAALCCMALAFDQGPSFGIDKPAGLPCPHLGRNGQCGIHDERQTHGFPGCITYSCNGAGQRVSQECFDGKSWREDPHLAEPMIMAFQKARQLHEWLLLLREAGKLPLPPQHEAELAQIGAALTPDGAMREDWLHATVSADMQRRIRAFLTSLRDLV